ncbi:TetR/AcrR family transcriptional regulator [Nonomuraea sp. AD125B]|uniref:TetR/AcrR family transcriptional regulator n=1 Tax=Nonomuraea sp. AD125B TaxID=3242897 RepID=UPI003529B925
MTEKQTRAPRLDARRNHARILEVAHAVVAEQGTQASLRDVARRAGIGLGTLYRHFPTRDELLETLLGERFDRLAATAAALETTHTPADALTEWLAEYAAFTTVYRGLTSSVMATLEDENSSLHASCLAMRQTAGRLLSNAQQAGLVRSDVTGIDLFALVNAVGWIAEQAPSLSARRDHLLGLVLDGLRPAAAGRP